MYKANECNLPAICSILLHIRFTLLIAAYALRALSMAKKLEADLLSVICISPTSFPGMPFGGYKASGIGREGWNESLPGLFPGKMTVMIEVDHE
jgi:hypothetical protein